MKLRPTLALAAASLAAAALVVALPAGARPDARGSTARGGALDVQGHRGTRGLRPENTLAAFGLALQLGVSTLELDLGVSRDGVVIVSHERRASTLECQGAHIGQLWTDLTLAQIKTLDCGTRTPPNPATDPFVATQEAVPGTRMPTLAEVFELVERYGAKTVELNVETKLDPTLPGETVDAATFARRVVETIAEHGMTDRTTLQSFDWRTLVEAKNLQPRVRTVALAQAPTIFPGTPWTAGVPIGPNPFEGSVADAAKSIGASALSPRFNDVTDALIRRAHRLGLDVIPWTVNDKPTMHALIARDVDGIITDYPNLLREVLAERGLKLPKAYVSPFDVEAHRGGATQRPENTLAAFAYALSKRVDTLELDTGVTADGVLVVLHDRRINGSHCVGPHVGELVRDLTLAQIKQLDCGSLHPSGVGVQRIPTLQEVFDLVRASGDTRVRFNIETKISPLVADTVPADVFARKLVDAIEANGLERRAVIQSFDWRTIMEAGRLSKRRIDTVALVWQFAGPDCDALDDECSLEAVVGNPSVKSPWTNGVDWWASRNLATMVREAKADVVSANWQVHDPDQGTVASSDWYAKEDPSIYHGPSVADLQAAGLRVVPYTIDREQTIQRVIDLGVDGIISNDVDLLQLVAKRNGLE